MKRSKFRLGEKLVFFTVIIILVSTVFTATFFSRWTIKNLREQVRTNNMNIAINISSFPDYGDLIVEGDPNRDIQKSTDVLLEENKNIDMIVVADMDGIRYSHPNIERLGKRFVGGDEVRVVEKGERYISEETGTLGRSIRAFSPIKDSEGNQVGFILIGTLLEEFTLTKLQAVESILIYSLGGIILGILGALILTYNIKRSILGLEPYEISQLYMEKNSILEAIQEGIISIDSKGLITTINDSAMTILGISNRELVGEKISDIIPDNFIEDVLINGGSVIERETRLNNINVVINIVPIRVKGKITGVIATFRDKSEVTKLAREITGYNEMVQSLRANSHEFLNKIHVVLGLIEIGELDEAKRYILQIKNKQESTLVNITQKVSDPIIGGLILGKISRARELGVNFLINQDSNLSLVSDKNLNTALVTILGNIIENAYEATVSASKENKQVDLYIMENNDCIKISVEDNGIGIKDEDLGLILERGYSSKGKNRGIGLSLVQEKLETIGGRLKLRSKLGQGTRIEVFIPKEG